jgi:phospholipase/lecithinase/hemolysin
VSGGLRFPFIVAVLMTFSSSAEEQPRFDHLVVFGDSLSDSGNAGRFSNGPVWVEQLDVAGMAERARSEPASYGFNVTTPCIASGRCEKYLFWDGIHPTTSAPISRKQHYAL